MDRLLLAVVTFVILLIAFRVITKDFLGLQQMLMLTEWLIRLAIFSVISLMLQAFIVF